MRSPHEQAMRVLEDALRRSGAQDAAHTALQHARAQAQAQAAQTARQTQDAAERAAARDAAEAQHRRWHARPLTPEHSRAVQQLEECRAEREQLRAHRDALQQAVQQTGAQLEQLPRWARRRRRTLTDALTSDQQELHRTDPTWATLDAEIDRLTRQVAHHSRLYGGDVTAQHRLPTDGWDLTRALRHDRRGPGPGDSHDRSTITLPQRYEASREPERNSRDGRSR